MITMPAETTSFTEKFSKLADAWKQADLAVAVKISPQSLQRYLAGSAPRPHTALLMAKAFDVDPIWFMDEDQPWREDYPHYPTSPRLEEASDNALLDEVALRFQLRANWYTTLMDRLNRVDWESVWECIAKLEPGDELPDELKDIAEALRMRGHFPHVNTDEFWPQTMLTRKIDQGELPRIDPDGYDFRQASRITLEQRQAYPKLEMSLSRLHALGLITDIPGPYDPSAIPEL